MSRKIEPNRTKIDPKIGFKFCSNFKRAGTAFFRRPGGMRGAPGGLKGGLKTPFQNYAGIFMQILARRLETWHVDSAFGV